MYLNKKKTAKSKKGKPTIAMSQLNWIRESVKEPQKVEPKKDVPKELSEV